ncbi:DgyrCDS4667 [Dimorphilus gyrociliatus]|nr:DgyrCDS4667 [Dimorphilus gyrociliatus]
MRITLTDGRILIGVFLCTDRDQNIIIGSCAEYLNEEEERLKSTKDDQRLLGLAMVGAKHMVSIQIDSS